MNKQSSTDNRLLSKPLYWLRWLFLITLVLSQTTPVLARSGGGGSFEETQSHPASPQAQSTTTIGLAEADSITVTTGTPISGSAANVGLTPNGQTWNIRATPGDPNLDCNCSFVTINLEYPFYATHNGFPGDLPYTINADLNDNSITPQINVYSNADINLNRTFVTISVIIYQLSTYGIPTVQLDSFRLEGLSINGSTISGQVTDDGGNPLPDVTITATDTDSLNSGNPGGSTVTDSNGNYQLVGLVDADYKVEASLTGYSFSPSIATVTVPPNQVNVDFVEMTTIRIEVLDQEGNPVSQVGINNEGWPDTNPLTVSVKLSCPENAEEDCAEPFSFDLTTVQGRFYLIDQTFILVDPNENEQEMPLYCLEQGDSTGYSFTEYTALCQTSTVEPNIIVSAGYTMVLTWQIWIQPSEAATLDIEAEWGADTIAEVVSVEQAAIHPIVFIHGLGATLPTSDAQGWHKQFVANSETQYTKLFDTWEKMGYEDGRTLFIYNYDWLNDVTKDAAAKLHPTDLADPSFLRDAAQLITGQNGVPWVKTYPTNEVPYEIKFDAVTHSTGALVIRAYIQTNLWNEGKDIRRVATIAGPHKGVTKIYTGWEGYTPGLGSILDGYLRGHEIVKRAYDTELYGSVICGIDSCNIDLTADDLYRYVHDPDHGLTIMPQFLPARTEGETALLRSQSDADYPYDYQANPLWLDGDAVTGQCSTENDGQSYLCDPYQDHPNHQTVFHGLNQPEQMEKLAERLNGLDNFAIVYANSSQFNGTVGEDAQVDAWIGFKVGEPSDTAPYWRNGKPEFDVTYTLPIPGFEIQNPYIGVETHVYDDASIIQGPSDGTVQAISGNPVDIWVDEDRIPISFNADFRFNKDNGEMENPNNFSDQIAIFHNLNDGKPSIFNVQRMHENRADADDNIQSGPLPHASLSAFPETHDAVVQSLTNIVLPPNFIGEYSPQDAQDDRENFESLVAEILAITVLSPVELTLTDSQGRKLGYDSATGDDLSEIPNGMYIREPDTAHKTLVIFSPEKEDLTLTLTGVGTGDYTLLGNFIDEFAAVNMFYITGTTTLGQVDTLTVTVPLSSTQVAQPPRVYAGADQTGYTDQPLTFTGAFIDINPDDTHTLAWDFGDGGIATDTLTTTHTFIQAGTFTVTLTVTDSVGFVVSDTLQATIAPTFREAAGQVVIEAEHFGHQIDRNNQSWLSQTSLSGFAGASYVSALPDTGNQFTIPYTTTSPELQYALSITTTGTYTIWLRGYTPNSAGDSLYVGLSQADQTQSLALTGFPSRQWAWANQTEQGQVATVTINQPGVYTLHLWQREDGIRLDRILLTQDAAYNPLGDGPPESEFR